MLEFLCSKKKFEIVQYIIDREIEHDHRVNKQSNLYKIKNRYTEINMYSYQ